ncbi:MAG: D-cysteine desulfhydrase family protein [archaeon]
MQISKVPRVRLADLPTPLEEAPRLTKLLDGPRILIKRDDLTGPEMGGNKARKLEFLIADALEEGADTIITTGATQSNHARISAASSRRYGLEPVLVLRGEEPDVYDGNLLIDELLGAEIRFVPSDTQDTMTVMKDVAEEYRDRGRRPYIIPSGGSNPIGALAYANAMLEITNQANDRGVYVDYVIHSSGSGGTQSGLLFGAQILNTGISVLGVSDGVKRDPFTSKVVSLAEGCSKLIGSRCTLSLNDVKFFDKYAGLGYGILQKEVADAIRIVARTEGVLLDPVYTGKAMWGLMDLIAQGYFERDECVVFLHSGGTPALFAYKTDLMSFK